MMHQWTTITSARPQQSTRRWPAVLVTTVILVVGIATAAPTRRQTSYLPPVEGLSPAPARSSSVASKTVPAFIMELYKCWSKTGTSCPSLDVALESVDLVRSFVGSLDTSAPKSLLRDSSEEVSNSTTMDFNLKCTQEDELFVDAEVRLFREPLDAAKIESLEALCSLSDVRLELYSRSHFSQDGDSVVVLESQIQLSRDQLENSQWIVFKNISQQYLNWMDDERVSLTIAVGGSCRGVSASDFGLNTDIKKEALLLGFYNMDGRISEMEKQFARDLGGRMSRQADVEGPTGIPDAHRESKCQLYNHNVSIAELGWQDYILFPEFYDANYCSGHCKIPLTEYHNTTKHSYIQAIAHYNDPTVVPSPCCVPIHLSHIPVIYVEQPGSENPNVNLRDWKDVSADACGCR